MDTFIQSISVNASGGTDAAEPGIPCIPLSALSSSRTSGQAPKGLSKVQDAVNESALGITPTQKICFNVVPIPNTTIPQIAGAQVFTRAAQVKAKNGVAPGELVAGHPAADRVHRPAGAAVSGLTENRLPRTECQRRSSARGIDREPAGIAPARAIQGLVAVMVYGWQVGASPFLRNTRDDQVDGVRVVVRAAARAGLVGARRDRVVGCFPDVGVRSVAAVVAGRGRGAAGEHVIAYCPPAEFVSSIFGWKALPTGLSLKAKMAKSFPSALSTTPLIVAVPPMGTVIDAALAQVVA